MRKNLFIIACILSLALAASLNAQTITSTSTGGLWNSGSTWVGGVVPTASHDVVINGPVQVNGNVPCRNLTVSSSGVLENLYAYGFTLTVHGNVINSGVIRLNPVSHWANYFGLTILGNITNNGTWTPSQTTFAGTLVQEVTLLSGKKLEGAFVDSDSLSLVRAKSNLHFTSTFNLQKSTLDLQNYSLTLEGSGNISNGKVTNTADVRLIGGALLSDIRYVGAPNLRGLVQIGSGVILEGTVTIVDTLQNLYAYGFTLTVHGNVINSGVIRLNPVSHWANYFGLTILGNITNNGTWTPSQTTFTGRIPQELTLLIGKTFDGAFAYTDSLNQVKAKSDLVFTNTLNLQKGVMDMQVFLLTLQGSGNVFNGKVMNTRDIRITVGAHLSDVTYVGNVNLRGLVHIKSGVTFEGTVTIVDTLQNQASYGHTLTIRGNIINNGVIRLNPVYHWANYLGLAISGSITNNGTWTTNEVNLTGSGSRTILARGVTSTIRSTGTKVSLSGDNFLPNLTVVSPSRCILENGTLRVEPGTISGTLENRGQITTRRRITTTQDYGYFAATVRIVTGSGLDTLTFFSHGHQVPQTFANAVKSWWRVSPIPSAVKGTIASLTLSYTDAELGSHNESNIQLYHSADSGKSWTQVSTSLNTTRNATANTIAVTSVPAWGDFLVSAVADPISVRPSIVVSVIGSPQIRVLAPNRYTVHYVNNSDFPTDDFLLAVNVGEGIRILRTEHPQADGKLEVVPFDSLSFEGEDSTFVFYAAGMGSREERTFNIIATANAIGLGKTSGVLIEPLTITVGSILVKAAVTYAAVKTIDWVGRKAIEWTGPTPEEKRFWESRFNTIPEEIKQETTKKEWAMKKISSKIISKITGVAGTPITLTRAVLRNLWNLGPNLRRKIFGAIQRDLEVTKETETIDGESYQTEITGTTQMKTQRVTSWDPNEKVAPSGYGSQGFISTVGRMNYRILFENLKTAQAPAWRVIIVDTLRSEYDPATVEFGNTSHDSAHYQWKMTRTGNILRWEIEGIELPPNKTPPEGEGYVTFTVMPKDNLASGTAFRNRAEIVFDLNKPILTNTVVNTLDFTPPTTTMRSLPATHSRDSLVVKWQSSDGPAGSGIESVALFASKDGGPFVQVGMTFADSITVKVTNGEYKFYGLAVDNVGNIESQRPALVQTLVLGVVKVKEEPLVPFVFALHQNYPNPFNPTTTIEFSLAHHARATLTIYDVLGRSVTKLVDEERDAGKYKVIWDATRFSSGVYFLRLQAGDFVETKRLVLIR